jgi:Asp-tRNA(Asn)/Glu-tRNA(Gln) amidotransferase A subunit family amidase
LLFYKISFSLLIVQIQIWFGSIPFLKFISDFSNNQQQQTKNPWKYNFYSTHCEDQQNKSLEQVGMRSYHTLTDDWHVAGGSSGGSAVAVASGVCYEY